MQLASSLPGLSGSPSPEMLKALQYNPLLYYSYYAQMISALQAQQKILDMNNTGPANSNPTSSNNNNNNSSTNSIKDILSPVKLGKDSNQVSDWQLITIFLVCWIIFALEFCCCCQLQHCAVQSPVTLRRQHPPPWCINCLRVKFSQLSKKSQRCFPGALPVTAVDRLTPGA